jgi:hypothetical protein
MCGRYPSEGMKAWKVAPLKGDGPQLLEPLKTPPEAMQVTPSLFCVISWSGSCQVNGSGLMT